MLHCQISISRGRLFGQRIIFARDPEHLDLADFLTEIKCWANRALLPPGTAQLRAWWVQRPPQPALGTVSLLQHQHPCAGIPPSPCFPIPTPSPAPLNLLLWGMAASVGPAAAPAHSTAALGTLGLPQRVPAVTRSHTLAHPSRVQPALAEQLAMPCVAPRLSCLWSLTPMGWVCEEPGRVSPGSWLDN